MKHVVLFSGGVGSAYTAYLVLKEQKKEDVILLHTPTFSENHDADTFRCRVARYLGMPITEWGDGRNLDEVIAEEGIVPGYFLPFCTRILKQEMKEQFYRYLKEQGQDFIEYVGFGMEEWSRVQKATARAERMNRKVAFPLFEQKISGQEIKRVIQEEWGIPLPEAYGNGLKHNNCIPCYKAGKGSWRIYWEKYPDRFQAAVEHEKKYGDTVFKDYSLEELAAQFQNEKEWDEMQYSLWDYVPCECCA